jgi:hypothetical protein
MIVIYFNSFDSYFDFLSNFHPSPFTADSVSWPTVEHFYQAQKAAVSQEKWNIWRALTPAAAKRMGKKVTVRKDWERIKDEVMLRGVREKFKQNPELRERLQRTRGFSLVEYAPWGDTYWGVGKDYQGENRLGKILMRVREELK